MLGISKLSAISSQPTTAPAQSTKEQEAVKCTVHVEGYTVYSSGSAAACNFTLDLSQSALRGDLEGIKQALAALPGQKSIEEIKLALEELKSSLKSVADKGDVAQLLGELETLVTRGFDARFGFGSKFGSAVFATSLGKQVGDLSVQATGFASLPSDAGRPHLCGEVGAGQQLTLGLGACLHNDQIQRYVTLGYHLPLFEGYTTTTGLEFTERGISLSFVIVGQGIR
jgi:hypothetical protein